MIFVAVGESMSDVAICMNASMERACQIKKAREKEGKFNVAVVPKSKRGSFGGVLLDRCYGCFALKFEVCGGGFVVE